MFSYFKVALSCWSLVLLFLKIETTISSEVIPAHHHPFPAAFSPAPLIPAVPLATLKYYKFVPHNVPPHAYSFNIVTRALNPIPAYPTYLATPVAAVTPILHAPAPVHHHYPRPLITPVVHPVVHHEPITPIHHHPPPQPPPAFTPIHHHPPPPPPPFTPLHHHHAAYPPLHHPVPAAEPTPVHHHHIIPSPIPPTAAAHPAITQALLHRPQSIYQPIPTPLYHHYHHLSHHFDK